MNASDIIHHLADSSTRSRDAIKKRRQRHSYISMASNLRAAAPASPNLLLSENQNPTNFSIAENQELVAAVESLLLNDQDATLRRKNLASPERGKNALAEWANRLTGCISRVSRNTRRQTANQTTTRNTNRARRAAENEFAKYPRK
uniref:Uncharacterized protein n=1 Tax=Glossina austeni TaxID=7395 RepID=A0A1A9UY12_GLOAU